VWTGTSAAGTSWSVTHNQGSVALVVTCWNDSTPPEIVVPDKIEATNTNTLTINWGTSSVAGRTCVVKCA
jgi:hypothetical protein